MAHISLLLTKVAVEEEEVVMKDDCAKATVGSPMRVENCQVLEVTSRCGERRDGLIGGEALRGGDLREARARREQHAEGEPAGGGRWAGLGSSRHRLDAMNRMVTSPCCGWRWASKESRAPRQPFTQVTNWKRGRRSRRKRLQIQNRAQQTLDLPASKGQPVRGEGARRRCGITTELRHLGLSRPLVHTSYIKYYICSRGGEACRAG